MKMYKLFIVSIFLMTSCLGFAQKKLPTNNYEVQPLDQGAQGTILLKVFSYGRTVEEAVLRGKINAVHAVLFKGIAGSNLKNPIITPDVNQDALSDYFNNFLGVDDFRSRRNIVKRGGDYLLFVQQSNDGSIDPSDRLKVRGGYKVGIKVQVNHNELRKKMENDAIIKKFGL